MHSKWNIIKIKFSIEISTGNLLNHSIFECTEIWGIVKSLGKFVQPTSKYFNFFNFDTCTLILESIYNNNIWRILLFTNALLHSVKNYFKQYIQIITISWKNKQTGNLWSTPSLPPLQKELFYTWLILSRIHSLLFLHQNLWLPPPLQVLFYTTFSATYQDLLSGSSPVCRWWHWNSRAPGPPPRSRSTHPGGTGQHTQSPHPLSYHWRNSSQSTVVKNKRWRKIDEIKMQMSVGYFLVLHN